MTNNELGKIGEDIATEYLRKKGFTILSRNWNLHRGCELDIVARMGTILHFVEVKTRSHASYSMPEQAITDAKLVHIHKAIQGYCRAMGIWNVRSQIDSISIVYTSPENYSVEMYEDIDNPFR